VQSLLAWVRLRHGSSETILRFISIPNPIVRGECGLLSILTGCNGHGAHFGEDGLTGQVVL
jgi:hypothetical protein